ncbi:MAG: fasciclin domain-containing protein, partial [Hydrogenophaga sp.]|nr:fasciclin domain-containing protein [Hydrogenophaga sp.]
MTRWMHWVAALATTSLLAACGGGDNDATPAGSLTLAQALSEEPSTSEFMKLVQASGMAEQLRSDPSLTVLAPSNEALMDMDVELGALKKPENQAELREFVASHIVPQRMMVEDMKVGQQATLSGKMLEVAPDASGSGARFTANGVALASPGQLASNGVFYVVRLPLWRPSALLYLKLLPDFSILNQAVKAAGLESALNGSRPFTLLAPTNAAFASLLTELGLTAQQLLANRTLLTEVLTYHVVPSQVQAAQIRDGGTAVTVQGQALTFDVERRDGPDIRAIDAQGRTAGVIRPNLFARNGVLHVVDRVVLPQSRNLVQIAQSLPDFSILVNAVVAAGLVDTLSGPGPFTVFAPTNAAFAALLAELNVTADQLLANTDLLTRVLTYHVLPGRVLAADITEGATPTTVQGGSFTLSLRGGPSITDARGRQANIVATNVQAANGVIHVIDRVILPPVDTPPPPPPNIVQVAQSLPDFSILVEAVVAAGLADTLSAPGPFTVFAPTNTAFAALLQELGVTKEQLLANRPLLTAVLTYHVLPGRVL